MSDRAALLVAVAAAAGALAARPVPLLLAGLIVAAALATRRPSVLVIGVALATSGLASRSWDGLVAPPPQPVHAVVTLVNDPQDVAGSLRVDVRLDGRRVEAWARGRPATRLRDRLAGERVEITGHLGPVPDGQRTWLATRHVAARLSVDAVGRWEAGHLASRLANGVRHTLVAGAASMPAERRALFTGFVLGDDRGQSPQVAFDFRAAGLTHLLVVSGQNVAFVLALAAPVLRRLGLGGRLVAGLAILAFFGTVTRWEPSVLRAVAMASIALLASAVGRPASTVRLLALAATALLLLDPLLVHSIGFRLSIGACLGIAVLARPLARAVPGPRVLAEAMAVTAAAQVGVAPVLIPTFGGVPVASLVANVLAVPAAGPLMAWGVAAGIPAGLLGGVIAALLHLPTEALIAWVAAVARVGGRLPLGQVGLGHVAVAALAVWGATVAVRRGHHVVAIGAGVVAAVAVLLPAADVVRPHGTGVRGVGRGATLWRDGPSSVVVLDGARGSADRMMSALAAAGIRHVDVLVASRAGAAEAHLAETIQHRFPAGVVLAPARSRLAGAVTPPAGTEVRAGNLRVRVDGAGDRLDVSVTTGGGRDPPG